MIKNFLLYAKDIEKSSYIWNTASGIMVAFQSVIMLMFITRTTGLEDAGIYTLAYANANLFLTIGMYGGRNFQVSDIERQYSFWDYRNVRFFTSACMVIISMIYILFSSMQNAYSTKKILVILFICFLKAIDALEDVFFAWYQREGRLDIGCKSSTIRLVLSTSTFGVVLIVTRNLLVSVIWSVIVSAVCCITFILLTISTFNLPPHDATLKKQASILITCFPLCLGNFMSYYIGNAPKYAIDSYLNDEMQACYGFIAMPIFVISLLNSIIFTPLIRNMSILWYEKKLSVFVRKIFIQIGILLVITLVCLVGAYLLGVPVLSIIYNTNLQDYKTELLILLFGSGFLAISGFLATILTIIRYQKCLLLGYGVATCIAFLLSPVCVQKYNILGAAILYSFLMITICIIFGLSLFIGVKRSNLKEKKEKE